jgi:protein arginine kinase
MVTSVGDLIERCVRREEPGDIVLSVRARLARNLSGYPFPQRASREQRQEVRTLVTRAAQRLEGARAEAFPLEGLTSVERQALWECNLLSSELAQSSEPEGSALLLNAPRWSVLVNEEDHLRICSVLPGKQLSLAWARVRQAEDEFSRWLLFARRDKFGYLTASPLKSGFGLSGSVLVTLPGLRLLGHQDSLLQRLRRRGLAIRGSQGEWCQVIGDVFQVTVAASAGLDEAALSAGLGQAMTLCERSEHNAREALQTDRATDLKDWVGRALGVLTHAELLSSSEAATMLARVRLGAQLGLLAPELRAVAARAAVLARPGVLQVHLGREMDEEQRAIERANVIRGMLN